MHDEDIDLISSKLLDLDDLVTIRQGEMILVPLAINPEPAKEELIKIKGKNGSWCCKFLDEIASSCTIYQKRSLACRLLKCWDTEDILKISGKKLLNRFDLVAADNPTSALIRDFEDQFPVTDMLEIQDELGKSDKKRDDQLARLRHKIINELRFRNLTDQRTDFISSRELFYFGRPLFQLIVPLGVTTHESRSGISLSYDNAVNKRPL